MQNMAIISSFKSIIYPMETKIFRTKSRFTMRNTATIYASNNQNISINKGENINILPTVQQSSSYDETLTTVQVNQQLQKRVRRIREEMIAHTEIKGCHAVDLVMIDAIQRLCLQYYFQNEISGALRRHYEICGSEEGDNDLHDTALRFRLLRQHGYNVSADCFSKFKDENGKLKQELRKDSKGLMSLYEAYHVRVPGDDILDDIGELSGHLLRQMKNNEPSNKGSIIENTLSNPYHKIIPRFTALDFLQNLDISMKSLHNLSDESSWMKEIQYLAAIDINMAQINHHRETTQVSRWWKGLGLTEELKLVRNQPAKWHILSLACLPSLDMGEQRVELTKAIAFVYLIDDIFDMYGTLDELILFTEVVNKWEYDNVNGLPSYMRVCLINLNEVINEISEKAYDIHGWNPKKFLQKVWKDLFNAFLVEAKWFTSGHMPSTDEYLKNGKVSCGLGVVFAYLFLLLGEERNKEDQGLLSSHLEIASLVATIVRLWDDLGSAKDENQNGYDGSYVACYMNEHKGTSTESAREHVRTMISDAWKCVNQTCQSSSFSAYFNEAALNAARMAPVIYNYDENRRLPSLEKYMKSLLISKQTTVGKTTRTK